MELVVSRSANLGQQQTALENSSSVGEGERMIPAYNQSPGDIAYYQQDHSAAMYICKLRLAPNWQRRSLADLANRTGRWSDL